MQHTVMTPNDVLYYETSFAKGVKTIFDMLNPGDSYTIKASSPLAQRMRSDIKKTRFCSESKRTAPRISRVFSKFCHQFAVPRLISVLSLPNDDLYVTKNIEIAPRKRYDFIKDMQIGDTYIIHKNDFTYDSKGKETTSRSVTRSAEIIDKLVKVDQRGDYFIKFIRLA